MIIYDQLGESGGRLGNQLFQVAATLTHAKKVGTPACFNPWKYRDYFKKKIDCSITQPGVLQRNGNQYAMVHRPHVHYEPLPQSDNLYLLGWFQSWKYVDEDIIREYFKPCSTFVYELLNVAYKFLPGKYTNWDVALHVRRTDYVVPAKGMLPNYYHNLSLEYYKKALMRIIQMDGKIRNVTIFSDDIPWCRNEFSKLKLPVQFTYSEGNSDIVDLFLMACHRHHIISNSTYPWWAAMLRKVIYARLGEQIVIGPHQWFGSGKETGDTDTKDIYCPGWIMI